MHICIIKLGHHYFRWWLVAYWHIVNWILRNKLQWNHNQNSYIFIQENASESVICEMAAILSRGRWVNRLKPYEVFIYQWFVSSSLQATAWRLFGSKPLLEPMLIYHYFDPQEQTWANADLSLLWSTGTNLGQCWFIITLIRRNKLGPMLIYHYFDLQEQTWANAELPLLWSAGTNLGQCWFTITLIRRNKLGPMLIYHYFDPQEQTWANADLPLLWSAGTNLGQCWFIITSIRRNKLGPMLIYHYFDPQEQTWANADLSLLRSAGTNLGQCWFIITLIRRNKLKVKRHNFFLKKMHLKMLSAKRQPLCSNLNVY